MNAVRVGFKKTSTVRVIESAAHRKTHSHAAQQNKLISLKFVQLKLYSVGCAAAAFGNVVPVYLPDLTMYCPPALPSFL